MKGDGKKLLKGKLISQKKIQGAVTSCVRWWLHIVLKKSDMALRDVRSMFYRSQRMGRVMWEPHTTWGFLRDLDTLPGALTYKRRGWQEIVCDPPFPPAGTSKNSLVKESKQEFTGVSYLWVYKEMMVQKFWEQKTKIWRQS